MSRRRGDDWKMPRRLKIAAYLATKDTTGRTLNWVELPVGTDLHPALDSAANDMRQAGWNVEPMGPGRWEFFANRNGVRVSVGVQRTQPGAASPTNWPTSER